MKLATLLLLLISATFVSTAATLPDEPSKAPAETSKAKVQKAKKLRAPLFAPRKKKESSYSRAMRRNELLR
ncbi:hypothetical protein [Hymenobacter sp. CRA2]|uniref:hypothetical protein n=1 Tax=Hymenobacter sp. CRA2 TaxID=1955620 RepID=UPI00098F95C6|nr:hypothetical protein [Hymenobacter sp. CRA2]OON69689.1 hypothetical protein B0919_07085 [Hymenobacter sp. CRA2]